MWLLEVDKSQFWFDRVISLLMIKLSEVTDGQNGPEDIRPECLKHGCATVSIMGEVISIQNETFK